MPFTAEYREDEPSRAEIDRLAGPLALEFGANWCGHCQALSPTMQQLLDAHQEVQHIRIADGRGKPLGRSFGVKLWPTVVLIRDGQVIEQLVRPSADEARAAFERLVARPSRP